MNIKISSFNYNIWGALRNRIPNNLIFSLKVTIINMLKSNHIGIFMYKSIT